MYFTKLSQHLKHKLEFIFFFIANLLHFTNSGPNNKCYVLALEGGGDKGSYQAGVINGLISNLPTEKTQYDVLTGISVGSLNAAGFSLYDIGNEQEASEYLLKTWRKLNGEQDVFQNWKFGPLQGLFYESGLYDTTPLKNLLSNLTNKKKLKRKIIIGATKLENGTYHTWDETDFENSTETFISAILASSAVPILFPNIILDDVSYVDGGLKISLDIPSGINKCFDMGYSEENIVVDAILCSSANSLPIINGKNLHPVQVLIRVLEIYGYDNSLNEIEDIIVDFPKIDLRYLIAPTKKLPFSILPLTFSPKDIETMIEIGISDAIDAIKKGENVNVRDLLSTFRMDRRKKRYGRKKN